MGYNLCHGLFLLGTETLAGSHLWVPHAHQLRGLLLLESHSQEGQQLLSSAQGAVYPPREDEGGQRNKGRPSWLQLPHKAPPCVASGAAVASASELPLQAVPLVALA